MDGTDAQCNPSAKCAPEKPPSVYIPLEGVDAARYQATTDHNHIIHHRRLPTTTPTVRQGTTIQNFALFDSVIDAGDDGRNC